MKHKSEKYEIKTGKQDHSGAYQCHRRENFFECHITYIFRCLISCIISCRGVLPWRLEGLGYRVLPWRLGCHVSRVLAVRNSESLKYKLMLSRTCSSSNAMQIFRRRINSLDIYPPPFIKKDAPHPFEKRLLFHFPRKSPGIDRYNIAEYPQKSISFFFNFIMCFFRRKHTRKKPPVL